MKLFLSHLSKGPLCHLISLSFLTNLIVAHPNPNLHSFDRRAVEWVRPLTSRSATSVCSISQSEKIKTWQYETIELARAGSEGLDMAFKAISMTTDFSDLPDEQRRRYLQTYITFFGWDEEEYFDLDEDAIHLIRSKFKICASHPGSFDDNIVLFQRLWI